MRKHIVPILLFIAYAVLLVKVMVFKDLPTIHVGGLMLNFGGTESGYPPNFIPFKTILPYLFGFKGLLIAGINLVGNVALLIPIGFLAPFVYPNMTWKKSLLLATASGLTIEILQTILHVGIFDIDDVILNALGVMVGFWFCAALVQWVSSKNYKKIIIAGIVILATTIFGWYMVFPHGQRPVNPNVHMNGNNLENENTYSGAETQQSGDLCRGTGGTGEIINQRNHTITIKSKTGTEQTITLTDQTEIRNSKGTLPESALKISDHVTVVIMDESKNATAVFVCSK